MLPKSWSTLQSLRSLITSKIKTDAIPNAALSHMTALSSLSMDYCNTKIFADNMTAMTALKSLCLRDCKLVRGWPSQVLPCLVVLCVYVGVLCAHTHCVTHCV